MPLHSESCFLWHGSPIGRKKSREVSFLEYKILFHIKKFKNAKLFQLLQLDHKTCFFKNAQSLQYCQ